MKTKPRKCLGCSKRFKKAESKLRKRCVPCAKKHAAEQSINLHREKMKDPEYRKKRNVYFLDWRTKKLASDPEYRERFDATNKASGLRQKKRRQEDPEYKKHVAAMHKIYYDIRMKDPEYRTCVNAKGKERQRMQALDPEYRKKWNAAAKKRRLEDPEKTRANFRRYYAKRVSTPEGREAHNKRLRDYCREKYANDPVWVEKRRVQTNAYNRLRRKEAAK